MMYRLRSNLTIVLRLVEKVVESRFIDNPKYNKLFPGRLSTYRHHSMEAAAVSVMNHTKRLIDDGIFFALVMFGSQSSIRHVNHGTLLNIRRFAFTDALLRYSIDLVSLVQMDKTQSISVHGVKSEPTTDTCSVRHPEIYSWGIEIILVMSFMFSTTKVSTIICSLRITKRLLFN